jgi:IS4 transposase
LRNINLPRGSILVFDKGYNNYSQWKRLSEEGIYWVTRENKAAVSAIIKQRAISEKERKLGVIEDNIVLLGTGINKGTPQLKARRIVFQDPDSDKCLIFVTNHYRFKASKIAQIYKHRWQIEVLFKRLKQNYPLKYFLGDNENAIKIQIWCSLICDLLIKLIKEKGTKRNWSYANLASIIRLHLGTYIDLRRFLDDPDRALEVRNPPPETTQLSLF